MTEISNSLIDLQSESVGLHNHEFHHWANKYTCDCGALSHKL